MITIFVIIICCWYITATTNNYTTTTTTTTSNNNKYHDKDLDKEMTVAEAEEKNAQEDYEQTMKDSQ